MTTKAGAPRKPSLDELAARTVCAVWDPGTPEILHIAKTVELAEAWMAGFTYLSEVMDGRDDIEGAGVTTLADIMLNPEKNGIVGDTFAPPT